MDFILVWPQSVPNLKDQYLVVSRSLQDSLSQTQNEPNALEVFILAGLNDTTRNMWLEKAEKSNFYDKFLQSLCLLLGKSIYISSEFYL